MQSSVLVKIKNVHKHYKNKKSVIKALDGVSLDIHAGEIISLLGANGAGKTTLSALLATLHPVTVGDITFNEKSIYADINAYRRQIGFCPQESNLNDDLTVEQNLLFAGKYFDLLNDVLSQRLEVLITRFNLGRYRHESPSILSGGYQRRVMIARSLMHNPKLLILDEPTVGIDPHMRHRLWESISALRNDGISVLLTTHYLDEAEFLADRICVLDKGVIKLIDTPENLKTTYQQSSLEDVFLKLMNENKEEA
jgi:ABC-2 type transport system ATP-binding protein